LAHWFLQPDNVTAVAAVSPAAQWVVEAAGVARTAKEAAEVVAKVGVLEHKQ
jgi:hypothetical protein